MCLNPKPKIKLLCVAPLYHTKNLLFKQVRQTWAYYFKRFLTFDVVTEQITKYSVQTKILFWKELFCWTDMTLSRADSSLNLWSRFELLDCSINCYKINFVWEISKSKPNHQRWNWSNRKSIYQRKDLSNQTN